MYIYNVYLLCQIYNYGLRVEEKRLIKMKCETKVIKMGNEIYRKDNHIENQIIAKIYANYTKSSKSLKGRGTFLIELVKSFLEFLIT